MARVSNNNTKLCNLGSKHSIDKPYWILLRKAPREHDGYGKNIVGECSVSSSDELNSSDTILSNLKNNHYFEGSIKLMPKDRLDMVLGEKILSFELGKRGWHRIGSNKTI